MALTPAQVSDYGERHVGAWLKKNGYERITRDKQQPGSGQIEADNLRIHVKSAEFPDRPHRPSSDEIHALMWRAATVGKTAYVACVTIDSHGGMIGDIDWSRP
jgi:hypothetical protein